MKDYLSRYLRPIEDSGNLWRLLAHGFAGIGFFKIIQLFLGLVISILLARNLGVDGFGVYSFVLSLATLLVLPAYAGVPAFIVREVAVYDQANAWDLLHGLSRRAHQFVVLLVLCIVAVVIMVSASQATWQADDWWTLVLVASIAMPFFTLSLLRGAILQGLRKVVLAKLPELLVQPVVLLILLLLIMVGQLLTPLTAMVAQIFSMIVSFSVGTFLLKTILKDRASEVLPRYEDGRWRSALLPFSIIGIVSYLNTELFVPLVGILAANEQVAYFRVALSLALLVALPLSLVESVSLPHVARLYSKRAQNELTRLIWAAGMIALVISLPMVIVIVFFGDAIISLLYGQEYAPAYYPLLILSTGFALVNIVGPSMQLLYATEFEKDAVVISALSVLAISVLSTLWIPKYGALGAAGVFSITKLARALAFRWWAHRRLRIVFARVEDSREIHK